MSSVVRLARALANNTALRYLGLANNNVGVAGSRALIQSAEASGVLVDVVVTNAGVGNRWQASLLQALRRNQRWQQRDWSSREICASTRRPLAHGAPAPDQTHALRQPAAPAPAARSVGCHSFHSDRAARSAAVRRARTTMA